MSNDENSNTRDLARAATDLRTLRKLTDADRAIAQRILAASAAEQRVILFLLGPDDDAGRKQAMLTLVAQAIAQRGGSAPDDVSEEEGLAPRPEDAKPKVKRKR